MPRYSFTINDEISGLDAELPGDDAAWRELIVFTGELLKDGDDRVQVGKAFAVRVLDDAGDEVAAAVLSITWRGGIRPSTTED